MHYIHAKVFPQAKKEELRKITADHFEISVREKPQRNLANTRVIEILASHFKVSLSKVRIINGHRSTSKLIVIE